MNLERFLRTEILIGRENLEKLQTKRVIIFGLGGVGSYAIEALGRCAIGEIHIVDFDCISKSNINRQLLALESTLGKSKVEIMKLRLEDINPTIKVITYESFFSNDTLEDFSLEDFDYVLDAIDSLNPKVTLLEHTLKKKCPLISSMGAGGRLDPTAIRIGNLIDVINDKLASSVRKRLRRRGLEPNIEVIYSIEKAIPSIPPEDVPDENNSIFRGRKRSLNGSISYIPSIFGLMMAGTVINHFLNKYQKGI